jgi:hypothetical protein
MAVPSVTCFLFYKRIYQLITTLIILELNY